MGYDRIPENENDERPEKGGIHESERQKTQNPGKFQGDGGKAGGKNPYPPRRRDAEKSEGLAEENRDEKEQNHAERKTAGVFEIKENEKNEKKNKNVQNAVNKLAIREEKSDESLDQEKTGGPKDDKTQKERQRNGEYLRTSKPHENQDPEGPSERVPFLNFRKINSQKNRERDGAHKIRKIELPKNQNSKDAKSRLKQQPPRGFVG